MTENVLPFVARTSVEPEKVEVEVNQPLRQTQALHALRLAGERGLTWAELGSHLGLHHGASSGLLSRLHKRGLVMRLQTGRGRSSVYVLPEFLAGRYTYQPRPRRDRFFEEAIPILAGLSCEQHDQNDAWCPACRRAEQASALLRRYRREVQQHLVN